MDDDLNDIFDDIVLAENRRFDEGFREGVNRSKAEGYAEGFGLGLGKGLQVGTTLGYYRKFAEAHLQLLEELARSAETATTTTTATTTATNSNPPASVDGDTIDKFPPGRREKLAHSLKVLLCLIDNFSVYDCENEALFFELGKIESKFKQIKALISLKVAPQIRHSPKAAPKTTSTTTSTTTPNDLSF